MKLIDARNAQRVLKTIDANNTILDKIVERAEMVENWLCTQQNEFPDVMGDKTLLGDIMIFNKMVGNIRNIISVNCVDKTIKKTQKRYSGLGDMTSTESETTLTHAEFLEWFANTNKESLMPRKLLKVGQVITVKDHAHGKYRECLIISVNYDEWNYSLIDLENNKEYEAFESIEKIEKLEITKIWSNLSEYWTC